ncbi:MAG: CoA transferase [Sphingomonadales bacterium]|nr:MAG: CoA transferase [Sphingomonadales bacterium]
MSGPLAGLKIIELAGIGPGPFAGMMLADHGAEVIRIERPSTPIDMADPTLRSRRILNLDLKRDEDRAKLLDLIETADALFEGYRPGTIERMGLAPEEMHRRNPRLVVGRMTGWGQTGRNAMVAGHDINYIAVTGALHAIGPAERPLPPLALAGDYGGGGMLLAFSLLAAILHAQRTGEGQVIDCAMCDGAGLLMTPFFAYQAAGWWKDERASNILDGGAHFYNSYRTGDGHFVAIGSIEPQFYAILLEKLQLTEDPEFLDQMNQANWPRLIGRLDAVFATKTRAEWCDLFDGTDACFAPVLSLSEAASHPLATERASFVSIEGVTQPAPAPRYSATPLESPRAPRAL